MLTINKDYVKIIVLHWQNYYWTYKITEKVKVNFITPLVIIYSL